MATYKTTDLAISYLAISYSAIYLITYLLSTQVLSDPRERAKPCQLLNRDHTSAGQLYSEYSVKSIECNPENISPDHKKHTENTHIQLDMRES